MGHPFIPLVMPLCNLEILPLWVLLMDFLGFNRIGHSCCYCLFILGSINHSEIHSKICKIKGASVLFEPMKN